MTYQQKQRGVQKRTGCDVDAVPTTTNPEEKPRSGKSIGSAHRRVSNTDVSTGNKQIDRMIQVYDEIFRFYLKPGTVRDGCWETTRRYWQERVKDIEKFLKWSMATLVAKVMDQEELPPKKDESWPDEPFQGWPMRVVKQRLLMHRGRDGLARKRQMSFAWSLLQGKAGSLPVDETFRSKSVQEAVERLTTQHHDLSDEMYDKLHSAVRRVVNRIYSANEATLPSRIPSRSASFETGRGKGGTLGTLLEDAYQRGLNTALVPDVLYGMSPTDELRCPDPWILEEIEEDVVKNARELKCRPIGLLEPFKVRVITVGTASEYHLMRQLQPLLFKPLRGSRCSKLVGKPLEAADCSELKALAENFEKWMDDPFWVSGDYEAATDYLNPELAVAALKCIAERVEAVHMYLDRAVAALVGHQIEDSLQGSYLQQVWGQLMGSPISFPILNIINLAATLLAFEERFGREFDIEKLPIMTNGDDVGFRADKMLYALWKRCTMEAGLKFSLGKNYTHRRYLILNSQMHDMKDWACPLVPHLQSGCLWGRVTKSNDPADSFDESPLACLGCVRDLHRNWPERTEYLTSRFIRLHEEALLTKVPRMMSWFAPRHLGGLGLPTKKDVKSLMTEQQLRLAKYLWDNRFESPLPTLEDLNRPEDVKEARRRLDEYHVSLGWRKREVPVGEVLEETSIKPWISWAEQGYRSKGMRPPTTARGSLWSEAVSEWKRNFYAFWKVAVEFGGGNLPREAWDYDKKIVLVPPFRGEDTETNVVAPGVSEVWPERNSNMWSLVFRLEPDCPEVSLADFLAWDCRAYELSVKGLQDDLGYKEVCPPSVPVTPSLSKTKVRWIPLN